MSKDIIERLHTSLPSLTLNDDAAAEITTLRAATAASAAEVEVLRREVEVSRKWAATNLKAAKGGATDDLGDEEAVAWDAYMTARTATDSTGALSRAKEKE